ncbi:MAG: tRNA 2-thiocytidine biosynthesis TtcA family protein [Erysipelotrichaceae bacterium]
MELQKILSQITKADQEYQLIQDGDKIAVGISGGKDSMLLLTALSIYTRFSKHPFEVIAIHIDVGFSGMDFHEVETFCASYQIPFYNLKTEIYEILQLYKKKDDSLECSLCAKLKKGAIIKEAKRLGCNKIAFGHHGDDAIETLLLNMIHGARFATFPAIMYLSREEISLIRPLIYCFEEDIIKAVTNSKIPFVKSTCPNDGFTQRQDIKELLNTIYHNYPQAHPNFLKALHNEDQMELWKTEIRLAKDTKKRTD